MNKNFVKSIICLMVLIPFIVCTCVRNVENMLFEEPKVVRNSRFLLPNDNEELKRMLMGDGEIELNKRLKIDMSSWSVISPRVSRITGKGDNSTIEIYPDIYGSIELFERIENIELININIEIKSSDGSGIMYASNGIIREIINSKINGFHIRIQGLIQFTINEANGYLVSRGIYNSVLNDVGVIFDEMKIFFTGNFYNKTFNLISSFVVNENRIVYNGIYLKGNIMGIENNQEVVETGLLFGSIINVDLNYVVFDVEKLNFRWICFSQISLLIYRSNGGLSLNNIVIVIRKTFSYTEKQAELFDFYLTVLIYEIYTKLTINHCLIDIHFGEISIDYYDPKNKDEYSRKDFIVSGILRNNYMLNVIANYLQIKYYFENDFIMMKNNLCKYFFPSFEITSCKIVKFPAFLSFTNVGGSFTLKNCYFYTDKSENANVDVEFIHYLPNAVYSENSYFISNGIKSEDGIYTFITGDIENLYPSMRLIGYSKTGSIIYDPVIPYFDYNLNEINYEIFEKLKPNYDNFNEWNEETTTLQSTTITATTTIEEVTTATTEEERITTIITTDEITETGEENSINSNNENKSYTKLIIIIVVSVVAIFCIAGIICWYCKRQKRVSPENRTYEMHSISSESSDEYSHPFIGKSV